MALDRTWYNALVDDDGSNTVGTVWGKDDIKNLLDSVDAELARVETYRPYCELNLVGSQLSIPHNAFTTLTFDNAPSNPYNMVAPNLQSIIIPIAGVYLITANVQWTINGVGGRFLVVKGNGVSILPDSNMDADAAVYTTHRMVGVAGLAANTQVSVSVAQSSGAALLCGAFGGVATNWLRVDFLAK